MRLIATIFSLLFLYNVSYAGEIYFPTKTGNWDTLAPGSLGWNTSEIMPLYQFLGQNNTKAFIVLKDGKIVLEKYFGTFVRDSIWYWASAGKTLTAFLTGVAMEENFLKLEDKSSKYLGEGWTTAPKEKEDLITIWNQLSMTSGLDDGVPDNHCTIDTCLIYLEDAGTRWAYHNAPYTLLENVVENATGDDYNIYFALKVRDRIGMNGLWFKTGYNNVYYSNARSMARFGILMQNKAIWNNDTILYSRDYYNSMINTSQELNKSYGYLWWLNGKESFMLPGIQWDFKGSIMPDAPPDMFSALGKNGQILNISPETGLVVVRMGDAPDEGTAVAVTFNNEMWKLLNKVTGINTSIEFSTNTSEFLIYPNPASDFIEIKLNDKDLSSQKADLYGNSAIILNILGEEVSSVQIPISNTGFRIDVKDLPEGIYFAKIGYLFKKFVIVK